MSMYKSKRSATATTTALRIAKAIEDDGELLDVILVLLELHAERNRRR